MAVRKGEEEGGLEYLMKTAFIVLASIAWALPGWTQDFGNFLRETERLPVDRRQSAADAYLRSQKSFPILENDTTVHFLFSGDARQVNLAGDMTGWQPGPLFRRLDGTTLYYLTRHFEPDARLDYKFVTDSTRWILDPLNPDTCMSGFGPNSQFRMPKNVMPPETVFHPEIQHGTLTDIMFRSKALGNDRRIRVYLPAGFSAETTGYPVILFHDGLEFIDLGKADRVLDYLIANHTIVPVVAVFVQPIDRDEEYSGQKKERYTRFIVDELMPALEKRYRVSTDPSKRAMAGISNGGNIALYIGINHPGQFGKISAQSSNVIHEILKRFKKRDRQNLLIYTDIGKYDIDILVSMAFDLKGILQEKGYQHLFHVWNEGHSWCSWKEHLKEPLVWFLGGNKVTE